MMLTRHVIGYLPSLLVPAAAAFIAVSCYTRLLTPQEYGHYALALNAVTLLSAVFYYWLQISIPRLMPQSLREGTAVNLRTTVYGAFLAATGLLLPCVLLATSLVPHGTFSMIVWLATPLVIIRSLLNMNQAFHRARLDFASYNLIECGQSVLGLLAGLAAAYFLNSGAPGIIGGIVFGMACMLVVDIRGLMQLSPRDFSYRELRELLRFGSPLVCTYGLGLIIATSDRFLIDYYQGASQVGIYAAGYALMDRIMMILFLMVATPSLPLAVHRLEQEGWEAARDQTYRNGVAMLMIAVPACVGLLACRQQIAAVLIGGDFREGALKIMPWIAVSALMNGFSAHYFDHAFYLGKKPALLFFTQGPTAVLNLVMNLMLIPTYGYVGAAYATICSYALQLGLCIFIGRRVFPVKFPFGPACQIAVAGALMMAALRAFSFPVNFAGLLLMIMLGMTVYGLTILAFDVADTRTKFRQAIGLLRTHLFRQQ